MTESERPEVAPGAFTGPGSYAGSERAGQPAEGADELAGHLSAHLPQEEPEEDASARTVLIAVAANFVVALAKGVAAVLTGSSAMAAETAHSIADTANEVLLFVGVRRSGRGADDQHPFGYGQARYFWSLLAAVGIFVVGGLFAIYDGVEALRHPEPVDHPTVGLIVLGFSALLEGSSWITAKRQLRAEATARNLDLGEYMATSSDPAPSTVFLEDSAALIGLALAVLALVLHSLTGQAFWDGTASLLIGAMLMVVAFLLIRRNGALLIDESAPAPIRERLTEALAAERWVSRVSRLTAVYIGPSQLLVIAEVEPAVHDDLVEHIDAFRRRMLAVKAIAGVQITPVPPGA